MRIVLATVLFAATCAGCTTVQLRRSTISQASTLTELQYRQILSNLAMFSAQPSALPWHVSLRDGSAQITDTGTAGFLALITQASTAQPTASASRTVVDQWGMVPATDESNLRLLRMLYRNAFGAGETLGRDEDFANELGHELAKQTEVSDELRQSNALFQDVTAKEAPIREVTSAAGSPSNLGGWLIDKIAGPTPPQPQAINSRLFEELTITSNDECLDCDLGKPRTHEVFIEAHEGGFRVDPERRTIHAGDSVQWYNTHDQPHTVLAADGQTLFHLDKGADPADEMGLVKSKATNGPHIQPFPYPSDPNNPFTFWIDSKDGAKKVEIVVTNKPCLDEEVEQVTYNVLYNGPPNRSPRDDDKLNNGHPVVIEAGDAVSWVNQSSDKCITVYVYSTRTQDMENILPRGGPINHEKNSPPYLFSMPSSLAGYPEGYRYQIRDEYGCNILAEGRIRVEPKKEKSPLVKEICRQLAEIDDDLKKVPVGWFGVGCKKDVPKDACYVGSYGDRYAWVCPAGLEPLTQFTLKVLKLSTRIRERQVITNPGVRYSPGFANPARF